MEAVKDSPGQDGDWKTCPECAELVRGQARKCRFCGWRFDGGQPAATGMRNMLRKQHPPQSLPELLEDWGSPLHGGEEVVFFLFARADALDGYLLVTDLKVCFFASPAAKPLSKRPEITAPLFSRRVGMLGEVSTSGSRLKPSLRLTGGGEQVIVSGVARSKLSEIARYLRARQTEPS